MAERWSSCIYFNCTIQELKQEELNKVIKCYLRFQLHHTGIKTKYVDGHISRIFIFQLHHTGIKTKQLLQVYTHRAYFNCTIQELKLDGWSIRMSISIHFNCTIQELKHHIMFIGGREVYNFNCTIQELKLRTCD